MRLRKMTSALRWHPWAVIHKLHPSAGHSNASDEGQWCIRGLCPLCPSLWMTGFGRHHALWWAMRSWRCCLISLSVLCPWRWHSNWIWIPVGAQLKLSRWDIVRCKIIFCLYSTLEIVFHENTKECNGLPELSVCAVGNCVPISS